MPDTAPQKHVCFLDKTQLIKLRQKAIRSGVWFKTLQRIDRALVDLTIKVASSIRSPFLAKGIMSIARKLEECLESKFLRVVREIGFPLAQKLSLAAQKWGNASAESWASAPSFARFLAVMHINDPKVFKL